MARTRRAAQSAPQEVLVPEAEQPYAVPENWRWVRLGYGYEITSSKRIHKSDWRGSGVPFYRTRELVKLSKYGFVDNELFIENELYESIKETYGVPQIEDILISGVGTIGVPYVVSDKKSFYFKDGNIIWLKSNKIFNSLFIFYLYKTPFMYSQIHDMASGTTVDTYTIVNAKKTMVPLPPRAEQERIVARIESLFARLDKAREKVDAVLGRCAARKAALLHKAFSGELTAAWRKARGIGLESWEEKALKDCGQWCGGGTPSMMQSSYWNDGDILWITPKDMKADCIEDTMLKVSMEGINNSAAVLVEKPSLLFVMRSGILKRILPIAMVDKPFCVNQDLKVLQINRCINLRFLFYQCVCYEREILKQCVKSGTTVESVVYNKLLAFKIRLPKPEEQAEIVRILDELLARERRARDAAERVAARIEQIKRAVLTKAFRGELGTNDPAEPAALTEQGSLSLA